jgi:hypothetical protein
MSRFPGRWAVRQQGWVALRQPTFVVGGTELEACYVWLHVSLLSSQVPMSACVIRVRIYKKSEDLHALLRLQEFPPDESSTDQTLGD